MKRSGKRSSAPRATGPWRGASRRAASDESSRPHAQTALIIFAKSPVPGTVKTRLCPPLIPDEAATLHGTLVMDTLERTNSLKKIDRVLACTPSRDHAFFQALKNRHRIELVDQHDSPDLGARLSHASTAAFDRGYRSVIMIGSDLPTIDAAIVTDAYDALTIHDVVIGPSEDGGYYLIGLREPAPSLFADIPWSTETVARLTEQEAKRLGLSITMLSTQRDVDTIDDLRRYCDADPATFNGRISARTAQVFKTLKTRLSRRRDNASPLTEVSTPQ